MEARALAKNWRETNFGVGGGFTDGDKQAQKERTQYQPSRESDQGRVGPVETRLSGSRMDCRSFGRDDLESNIDELGRFVVPECENQYEHCGIEDDCGDYLEDTEHERFPLRGAGRDPLDRPRNSVDDSENIESIKDGPSTPPSSSLTLDVPSFRS
jgi:hypothetical protein